MPKKNIFLLAICLLSLSCGQNISTGQKIENDSIHTIQNDSIQNINLVIDTNRVTILRNNNIDFFSLKDSIPAKLTNQDLFTIDTLLTNCIKDHNKGIDSTNLYSGFIDLKKYKRQYVPYANKKGEKKVFINCFCNGVGGFDDWKTTLVEIEDGGVCFFNLTINVTEQLCGPVLINGPG